MRTNDFAVTLVLRIAIITTSIAGGLTIMSSIWFALTSHVYSFYGSQASPSVIPGLSVIFVTVMWTSIVLSFLLYMSWRVRCGSEGAALPAGYYPPGGPASGANARRQAGSY